MTDKSFNLTDRSGLTDPVQLCETTLAVDAEAVKLCASLSEKQLSWCPRPGRWSISQNLAHLRATTEVFLPAIDSVLEASRKQKLHRQGPFTLTLYGRLMVWRMQSRPIVRLKAPKALQPQLRGFPASELEYFLNAQAAMRQRIQDADGLDLTALRFSSPLASYFRVNLLEFFCVFNAHSMRHLRQANNVRRALAPSSPKISQRRPENSWLNRLN